MKQAFVAVIAVGFLWAGGSVAQELEDLPPELRAMMEMAKPPADTEAEIDEDAYKNPEIKTTPESTTGVAATATRVGRCPRMSHPATMVVITWTLPTTVANPAPMSSIAMCHATKSPARARPASNAIRRCARLRGVPRGVTARSTNNTGNA